MKVAKSIITYFRTQECKKAVLQNMPQIRERVKTDLTSTDILTFFKIVHESLGKILEEKKIKPEHYGRFALDNYHLQEKSLNCPNVAKKIMMEVLNLKPNNAYRLNYFV